jgi:hypothetical protein
MLTYKDFKTRTEFVDYLGLYHGDRHDPRPDWIKIDTVSYESYAKELETILHDLDHVRETWNNQSIIHIEQSVAKKGSKQLEIMQGQKQEKIAAGYSADAAMYRVQNCAADSVFNDYAKQIGLQASVSRYHVQFPGEVTVWHTDIYSPAHEFLAHMDDIPDEEIGKDRQIRRILISLQDWDWGHMLIFGKTPWVNWNAGDVIYWEYGVPHGSANMGFKPRVSVSITGLASDSFLTKCDNARNC